MSCGEYFWIGGGVIAVILSEVLLSIGSLLGIIVFPVVTLSILWGIIVLAHRRRPRDERYGNLPPNG